MSERVMKPKMFFMQQRATSLCTKGNLLWMEQQALRFRGYAISPGRWNGLGGGNGPFDVLCSDVYGEQFEKACIYSNTETDGITHTTTRMCEHTHHLVAHMHTSSPRRVHKPTRSSERCENTQQQIHTWIHIIIHSFFLMHTLFFAMEKLYNSVCQSEIVAQRRKRKRAASVQTFIVQ